MPLRDLDDDLVGTGMDGVRQVGDVPRRSAAPYAHEGDAAARGHDDEVEPAVLRVGGVDRRAATEGPTAGDHQLPGLALEDPVAVGVDRATHRAIA